MLRTLIFWSDRTFPDRRCITQRTGVFTAKLVSLETQISHQNSAEIQDESVIQRNWNLFLASAGRACSCPENLVKQSLMKCQDHVRGTSVYPRSLCFVLFLVFMSGLLNHIRSRVLKKKTLFQQF